MLLRLVGDGLHRVHTSRHTGALASNKTESPLVVVVGGGGGGGGGRNCSFSELGSITATRFVTSTR